MDDLTILYQEVSNGCRPDHHCRRQARACHEQCFDLVALAGDGLTMATRRTVLILAAVGGFLAWGSLNSSGFCFSEMRYVPDEEFLVRFLDSAPQLYRPSDAQIGNATGDTKAVPLIRYKTGAEYIAAHPDCCMLGAQKGVGTESDHHPGNLRRFLGIAWGLVAVHSRWTYIDNKGQEQKIAFFDQSWADSCGRHVSRFDY
jgi:hypothetical protein